uniref:Uncharacterized protein n=1 Tax=Meleagris gallopavo TaxID=9103 RepID=A0A803YCY5_MELGA
MVDLQHQLLIRTGGLICFSALLRCIRFMRYIFPHVCSALPQAFSRSLGEWAGNGNFLTFFFFNLSLFLMTLLQPLSFRIDDRSLMVSLTSRIYSCLKTSKATTHQCFFKDITYSHRNNGND